MTEQAADAIAERLVHFMLENYPSDFDAENFPREESLFDLQILDSFAILGLLSFAEEQWNIQVADEDVTIDNFVTVAAIAKLILRLQAEA